MKRKNNSYTSIEPLVKALLKDPKVRMIYEERKAKESLALAVKELRKNAHLTQSELAKKAGTTQVVIARLESGTDTRTTSMPLLARIATACGRHLEIGFPTKRYA